MGVSAEHLVDPDGLDKPPTLRAHAEGVLRESLLSGRLAPGDRVNEVVMAGAIGVSRGIIREALRGLEQEGLVVSRPHRGVFVRKLTPDEALEMSEVRMALEIVAARRIVAGGRVDAVRDALEERYAELERVVGEPFAVRLRMDLAFHEAICEASGNGPLLQMWRSLVATVTSMLLTVGPADAALLLDPAAHRPLLEVIEAGDETLIEPVWREHFASGLTYILMRLPGAEPGRA